MNICHKDILLSEEIFQTEIWKSERRYLRSLFNHKGLRSYYDRRHLRSYHDRRHLRSYYDRRRGYLRSYYDRRHLRSYYDRRSKGTPLLRKSERRYLRSLYKNGPRRTVGHIRNAGNGSRVIPMYPLEIHKEGHTRYGRPRRSLYRVNIA